MATTPKDKPVIVNLSGGMDAAMSLAQLSEWCRRRWGDHVVASDHEPRPYDLPWVVLDHSLATQTWSWKPVLTLDEVLRGIADFADSQSNWIGQSA
jgi:CDP-paratose 2-epimerase